MPKVPPKKKKQPERSENAVEATLAVRLNSTGAMVDFECGNTECQEQVSETEEHDFDKSGKITIEASKEGTEGEVECEACKTPNFNSGFTISKL